MKAFVKKGRNKKLSLISLTWQDFVRNIKQVLNSTVMSVFCNFFWTK